MLHESKTDWERVRREAAEDGPIPYDEEDRAEGLYDPNDDDAVEAAWASGVVTVTRKRADGVSVKRVLSVELSPEVVEHYQREGGDWQGRMEEVLRNGMH